MPKAVFFDLDETLIRYGTPVTELFQAVSRQHLADPSGPHWDRFHQHLTLHAGRLWQDIAQHQGRGEAEFRSIFRSSLVYVGDNPALAEPMVEAFLAAVIDSTGPTAGAHAVLDELAASGIATAIITNGFAFLQKRKASAHGLAERVRFVLTSEDAGAHKPDARIFRMALEQIGVDARDCWHVGDHRANDIAGALNAGLSAVLYTPDPPTADAALDAASPDRTPYRVITRLTEIPDLIAALGRD